jgi:hypothetical protein
MDFADDRSCLGGSPTGGVGGSHQCGRSGASSTGGYRGRHHRGSNVGIGNNGPVSTAIAGIGQSICPMLVQPGATFASTASQMAGNTGLSPAIAGFVTSMAIQMECPGIMTSLANGNMPFPLPLLPGANPAPPVPFQLPGANPVSPMPFALPGANPAPPNPLQLPGL